ncbi:MAG: exosortase O [Chloroflexi bacterium]|nr:exosortase O [Chloroflexota bacterium]
MTTFKTNIASLNTIQKSKPIRICLNAAIIIAWLWLYWPLKSYLAIIFSREDFRTNQILLISIVLLISYQIYKEGGNGRLDLPPRIEKWPLALMLTGSMLYLLVERYLDVNTLSASLFGLATYGLLGLWLPPERWRSGLPAALLLIGTLPFGDHMQTFIGYPMRIFTAAIVQDGLSAAGIASVGIDTILVFENGVSHIDLPCSGVKSLWTGALFLLAATWIEKRKLNLRWVGTAVIFTALLFIANLARVTILIVVGEIMSWRLAAEMLHIPLGVLGFAAACTAATFLLRTSPFTIYHSPFTIKNSPPTWFPPLIILTLTTFALLYTPRPITGLTQQAQPWTFPPNLIVEPMPLKPDENEWLTRDGAESADRYRFEWQGQTGTMILITSSTWRAHHRPERCFEVYGLSLDDSNTHLVQEKLPVRMVTLGNMSDYAQLSATYWFQSATQSTDDYGTRIWSDLAPQRDRWVLVSILFDNQINPHDAENEAFYVAMHDAVTRYLEES